MNDYPMTLAVAADYLRSAKRVAVFTGAGVSAESGIPTFRDVGGLWQRFRPDEFATPDGLLDRAMNDPRRAAEFVLALLEPIAAAAPNDGHRAIAALEKHVAVTVITQNIDGLHQEAGSTTVCEVHGSAFQIVTLEGGPVRRISRPELRKVVADLRQVLSGNFHRDAALRAVGSILGSATDGFYRPSIVLFGEPMAEPAWSDACRAADECDCMLTVGTSGAVYPAAALPERAQSGGANVIGVGPEPGFGDVWLAGSAAAILPALVKEAFA